MATPGGFEPPISTVTGWHVRPLHHGAVMTGRFSFVERFTKKSLSEQTPGVKIKCRNTHVQIVVLLLSSENVTLIVQQKCHPLS
jgi:hypothetical protein